MKRDIILKELPKRQAELRSRFGVESLSLFGSVARNEAALKKQLRERILQEAVYAF